MTAMATITTSVGALRATLRAAVAFAGDDDDVAIASVYIEAGGGVLTATATTRYVLGHARTPATGQWERGVPIDQEHVRWLIDGLAMVPTADLVSLSHVTSHIAPPRLRVKHDEFAAEVLCQPLGMPWPDFRALFTRFEQKEPALTAPILLAPLLMEHLAEVAELFEGQPARWTFLGPLDPVRVEIGDSFVALLMPSKLRDTVSAPRWPVPVGLPAST